MKTTTDEIREITRTYAKKIGDIPVPEFTSKPLPHKWSKIEVLGHLIDSADNNLRRFICGQYEAEPPFIIYAQEFWVEANDYSHAQQENIIKHWELINDRICSVLDNMPPENYTRTCLTSSDEAPPRSLEWLARDYVKHLKHHLNQIISGSFDITYP